MSRPILAMGLCSAQRGRRGQAGSGFRGGGAGGRGGSRIVHRRQ